MSPMAANARHRPGVGGGAPITRDGDPAQRSGALREVVADLLAKSADESTFTPNGERRRRRLHRLAEWIR